MTRTLALNACAMNALHAANCDTLRQSLEGREAIYTEQGALRVRVRAVQANVKRRFVTATVEEIPTPGLEVTPIHISLADDPRPLHWDICAGFLSVFSEHTWAVGYGGWSICTDPKLIRAIIALAAGFDDKLTPEDRYGEIMAYIYDHPLSEEPLRVFPD